MMKKSFGVLLALLFSLLLAQSVSAVNYLAVNKPLKLDILKSTVNGVEFKIKSKAAIAPKSLDCGTWFVVPRGHEDYKVLTAFLLTAFATKKKIDIEYDDDFTECLVPVDSVTLYQ